MGRTRHAKRKVPITASSNARPGAVGDKLPISASSASTRTVIRQFHVLIKRREQLLREIAGQNGGRKTLASGVDYLSPKEELSRIEHGIETLGGLERYQAMSSIGQSAAKGGGSEKVLISWIKESSPTKVVHSKDRLRLLDVGALKHDNYAASKAFIDATPIDLHSRHLQIIQQDFMQIEPASDTPFHHSVPSNTNWDIISLSFVLNFVPDPQERGRMLQLARDLLGPDGLLFVVVSTEYHMWATITRDLTDIRDPILQLPLPCLLNSRYLTIEYWASLMTWVGFLMVKERWKEGGKVGYWLFKRDESAISPQRLSTFSKRVVLRDGRARNNFCILLP